MIDNCSLEALHKLEDVLNKYEYQIYKYLLDNPHSTRQEISKSTGININSVCGRVKELMLKGLIYSDKTKINDETAVKCNCLVAIEDINIEQLNNRLKEIKEEKYIKISYEYASIINALIRVYINNIGQDLFKQFVQEQDQIHLKILNLDNITNKINRKYN